MAVSEWYVGIMLNLVKGAAGCSWKLNDMGTDMIFVKTFTLADFGPYFTRKRMIRLSPGMFARSSLVITILYV